MKFLRSAGLVVVGIAIGMVVSIRAGAAGAPQQPGAGTRLVITQAGGAQTPTNVPGQALYFIKDSKSGGCWLGAAGVGGGLALTAAPAGACD